MYEAVASMMVLLQTGCDGSTQMRRKCCMRQKIWCCPSGLWLEWWFYCRLGVMEVCRWEESAAYDRRFGVVRLAIDLQLRACWLLEMCGRLLWRVAVLGVQFGRGDVMLIYGTVISALNVEARIS